MKKAKYEIEQEKIREERERAENRLLGYKEERRNQKKLKKLKKRKLRHTDMPDFDKFEEFRDGKREVLPKGDFAPKSHNKDKQIIEYMGFVYFKYEAPIFLINELLTAQKSSYRNSLMNIETSFENVSLFRVFDCVSNGRSLNKLLKNEMSKKEVHCFLNSKRKTMVDAIIEAKLKFLNAEKKLIDYMIENNRYVLWKITKKNIEIFKYIAKNQNELSFNQVGELMDYFIETVEDVNIVDFFKRSLKNMLDDSSLWHVERIFIRTMKKTKWNSVFETWKYIPNEKSSYEIKEITSAKELAKEGKHMRHCVSSYANMCANGTTSILSLTSFGAPLVTVQVNKARNQVVQAKGFANRSVNNSELSIIRRWAKIKGLSISEQL